MNALVQTEINLIRKEYLDNPKRILQEYIQENEKIQGYRGRELLELLQNAVDELEGAEDKTIQIELSEKTLCVSNNGYTFSKDGVISLMYSNLSPKYKKNQYIGNKGTGFRSILNWAESVSIFSGNLSIEFNPKYAEEMLQDLLTNENVAAYKEKHPHLKIATLVAPKIIDNISNHAFDTTIQINLIAHDEIYQSVKRQLSQLDVKFLLFLENLENLIIIDGGVKIKYRKQIHSSENRTTAVSIIKYVDEMYESKEDWFLAHDNGKINEQSYGVTVAYKLDMSVKPDNLYCFFKTDVFFPVPALIHGTFELSEDRNHLIKNKVNERVLTKITHLLVHIAKNLAGNEISYLPLKLLATNGNFPNMLSWDDFDFNLLYRQTVEESAVFPTVNMTYISFKDNPKYYRSNLAEILYGEKFKELLLYTKDVIINNYIRQAASLHKHDLKYTYTDIVDKINSILPTFSIKMRSACCTAFLAEYEDQITDEFPAFMLDVAGKRIDISHMVFLQPEKDNEFSEPPAFTNIRYMNLFLRRALEEDLNCKTGRSLVAKLDKLNVREYNLTTIIQSVVAKLRSKANKDSKKTRSKCVSTVKWLWKNRVAISDINLKNIGIPLVARDRVMRNADRLYWGIEYGNSITENLFVNRNDLFVSNPSLYNISTDDMDEFIDFFSNLGVAKYPRIVFKEKMIGSQEYISLMKEKIPYPITVQDRIYNSEEDIINDNAKFISQIDATIIEYYEHILQYASTKAIISWLKTDTKAFDLISAERETGKSRAYLDKGLWQTCRYIPASKVWSYMRFEFFNRKWIDVDGKRYAPAECILFSKISDRLLPHIIAPNLEDFIENSNKKSTETLIIKNLLINIGVAEEFSKLSVSQFYNILLTLPSVDLTGELSRSLYTSIISAQGFNPKSGYSNNAIYKKYMENGQVFCKDAKNFISIKDTYYLREKMISREFLQKFNIIDIPHRQSKQTIETFLGVKPFPLTGKMDGVPDYHDIDNIFIRDFRDYMVFALCYRLKNEDTKEISKFKSLKVHLCRNITATYDDSPINLKPYDYIKGLNNEVYLKAPKKIKDIEQLKTDIDFCAVIAEIVTSTIDIQDANLFSKYRELYNYNYNNRCKVLLQEFGNIEVLTEAKKILSFTQSIKEQFLYACEQIGGVDKRVSIESKIDKIDFDDFNNIDNSLILIDILLMLDIDVADFNEKSEFSIDLLPYFKSELDLLTEQYKPLYKNILFESLKNLPTKEQECFLNKYTLYELHDFQITNSTKFNPDTVFNNHWNLFGKKSNANADDEYRKNRELFAKSKDPLIIEDLLKNTNNDSLLYFGKFNILESLYSACYEEYKHEVAIEESLKSSKTIFSTTLINTNITAPKNDNGEQHIKTSHWNRSIGMGKQRANEDWGLYTERSVYYALVDEYGKESVKWVSENARKDNVNPEGHAGHGYDISYINNDGKTIYVEVKSAKSHDMCFIITENELRFAEKFANQHEIILVTDIENNPTPHRISNMFLYGEGENRFENSRFAITLNGSYTVQCEPVQSLN